MTSQGELSAELTVKYSVSIKCGVIGAMLNLIGQTAAFKASTGSHSSKKINGALFFFCSCFPPCFGSYCWNVMNACFFFSLLILSSKEKKSFFADCTLFRLLGTWATFYKQQVRKAQPPSWLVLPTYVCRLQHGRLLCNLYVACISQMR